MRIAAILFGLAAASTALVGSASADYYFRPSAQTFGPVTGYPAQPTAPTPPALPVMSATGTLRLSYGQAWDVLFSASKGTKAYALSMSPSTPPSGLSVVESGETIGLSGRTKDGSYGPFVATVIDAEGKAATASIGPVVVDPPSIPFSVATSQTDYRFPKNQPWSVTFVGAGGLGPYVLPSISGSGTVGRYSYPVNAAVENAIVGTDAVGAKANSNAFTVTVGTEPVVVASPAPLTGLNVNPTESIAKVLNVSNAGDLPTYGNLTASIVSGPFEILGTTCDKIVLGGGTCKITVIGSGNENGAIEGKLKIEGMAAEVDLRGTISGF